MPARLMAQRPDSRREFDKLIDQKRASEETRFLNELSGVLPPAIEGMIRPVALLWYRAVQRARDARGKRAEDEAAFFLWLLLDRRWILMNDVALECDGEWMQIDHLLVGPSGIFLIETKSWRGVYEVRDDLWRKRRGRQWTVYEENPALQQERHVKLFRSWLWKNPVLRPLGSKVLPVVLFRGAKFVNLRRCRMLVYRWPWSLAIAFRTGRLHSRSDGLSPEDVERLASAIGSRKASLPFKWPLRRVGATALKAAALGLAAYVAVTAALPRLAGWSGKIVAGSWTTFFKNPGSLLPVGLR